MGTGEDVRKAGGRRSCEEVRGRWNDARKEAGRRIPLRKEGSSKGKRVSCKEEL